MIEVVTGSRLHFGLLNPCPGAPSLSPLSLEGRGETGRGERRFGGAGMMIEQPGFHLRVSPAAEWSAAGPLAERTLGFAHRVAQALENEEVSLRPHRLEVVAAPPEHAGLGTGTQLGMAVARALSVAAGREDIGLAELARLTGRGLRSALGVHGFDRGGFLVDAGQAAPSALAPLVAWSAVPQTWRVVLVLPHAEGAWHGERERQAFSRLAAAASGITERLCRLVLLGMLPAIAESNLDAFGEAVHEYNALAGEAFSAVQGGTYASARTAEVIAFLRGLGVKGVSQTSWGPTAFAVFGSQEEAEALADRVNQRFALRATSLITAPLNHGAAVERL